MVNVLGVMVDRMVKRFVEKSYGIMIEVNEFVFDEVYFIGYEVGGGNIDFL